MKYCYCIFFVFCSGKIFAQEAKSDSIANIEIVAYREKAYLPGVNIYNPALQQSRTFGRTDMSDLLKYSLPVLINNYGSGNASISIRGTNDDHTLVLWNGVPVNSITLGSMDISLLPVESASNMSVVTNAGANIFGSGTFGGALLLDDRVRLTKTLAMTVSADLSSFNSYRGGFNMHIANDRWQLRSNTFYQHAKNDFLYTDIYKFGQPADTIEHNKLQQAGTVNTFYYKINRKNFIHAGNWFQQKEKEVPNIMGSNQPSSKFQEDRASRSFLKYNHLFANSQLLVSASHIYDFLAYTDKLAPTDTFLFINSSLKAQRSLNSVSYRHFFKQVQFDVAADLNYVRANVSEYGKIIREFQGAIFSGVNYRFKIFQASATVRQEYRPGKYIRPMFGVNAGVRLPFYTVNISYSDKYHAPDFNDKYWTPGGNPDLFPERGYTIDISQQWHNQSQKKDSVAFRLSAYFTRIKDEIIWRPVTGLIWSPENMQSAIHYGLDAQLFYERDIKHGFIRMQVLYLFNRSEIQKNYRDNSIAGNLIAYKPQHMLKAYFEYANKFFLGGINYVFTGKRYTDNENIETFALGPYGLIDLYAGFGIPLNQQRLSVMWRIGNLLNTSYQSVRSYAQPGRTITFSIFLDLNKSYQNEN